VAGFVKVAEQGANSYYNALVFPRGVGLSQMGKIDKFTFVVAGT
jgi:hypothetical protein